MLHTEQNIACKFKTTLALWGGVKRGAWLAIQIIFMCIKLFYVMPHA